MSVPDAPATRVEDVVDVLHGVPVADPYRWLEDGAAPEVLAWSAAQNARTRAVLDTVGTRSAWHARLVELLRVGTSSGPSIAGDRLFSLDRWGGHDQAVLALRGVDDAGPAEPRVLVDPVAVVGDPTATIDWYQPSRRGHLVALGLSTGGSERSSLRVFDVEAGTFLPDEIPDTRACSLDWEPGDGAFVYTRYPEGDEYHRHVRRHVLGADPATDEAVLGPDDLPDPTAWPSVALSRDGRWLLVSLSLGWSRVDLRLLDRESGTWTSVLEGVEALTGLTFDDVRGRLVGVTTLDADRGRVVAVDLDRPQAEHWRTLVPEDADRRRVLEWAAPLPSSLLVRSTTWGVAELRLVDPEGGTDGIAPFPLPGVGDLAGAAVHEDRDLAVVSYTSFTEPPHLLRWEAGSEALAPWSNLPGAASAGVEVRQLSYTADDGVEVPAFVVDGPASAQAPDAPAPTILTGYGGFAIAETPAYSALATAWCEAGGRFVVAGIRGGAEEGEGWHRAGMRERKQRCFDDFFQAADWLVASGRATREGLALRGGSNGGLLMGACITQRPDLARAVHCAVPLLDMVRFHRFLIARLWIPEYGDPDVAEEFAWLHAYSPYHRVAPGTAYPATLLTTAEEDTRVDPCHARKFAALLQAATSTPEERPVLLRVESRAGHGVGKPVGKQADEAADVLTFLAWQLAVAPPA